MNVWRIFVEDCELMQVDDDLNVLVNTTAKEIILRYRNKMFVSRDIPNLMVIHFENVGDRDSMYNELMNASIPCYKTKEPVYLGMTMEQVIKQSDKQKKKIAKNLKKRGLI